MGTISPRFMCYRWEGWGNVGLHDFIDLWLEMFSMAGKSWEVNDYLKMYKVAPLSSMAKLVNISPISLWFMVPIITTGLVRFINHFLTGGPHIVCIDHIHVIYV